MAQQSVYLALVEHVKLVINNSRIPLDVQLLESFRLDVINALDVDQRRHVLNHLSELLPTLQQDPRPATALVKRLISDISFDDVLRIEPKVDFVAGLKSESLPIKSLIVDLLERAKTRSGAGDIVAGMKEVVQLLVQELLLADDLGLQLKISKLFEDLLAQPGIENPLLWRRLLGDREIYHTFYWICGLPPAFQTSEYRKIRIPQLIDAKRLTQKQKTVAQSRLLALLAKIDHPQIRQSHNLDVERAFAANNLLDFAVHRMVDYKRDILMHLNLIEFFTEWITRSISRTDAFSANQPKTATNLSPAMYYMQASGLHARTASYYHSPTDDSYDSRVLASQAGHYLEAYFTLYPSHALTKFQQPLHRTLARISIALQDSSSTDLALRPPHDLKVLIALPRAALLLQQQHEGRSPVYLQLPCSANSAAVFTTLALLFDSRRGLHDTAGSSSHPKDPSAARALYFLYLKANPELWSHVVKAAGSLALPEVAVAANKLISSFVSATWETLNDDLWRDCIDKTKEPAYYIYHEDQLEAEFGRSVPATPVAAILSSPALENVVPYLLKPAQTPTDLGVGGKADMTKVVNEIAAIRFEALSRLYRKTCDLKPSQGPDSGLRDLLARMKQRLDQGRWGGSIGVGGNVATMEL